MRFKRYLKLYFLFFKYSLMRMMEHRFDFLFRAVPTTLSLIITVLAVNFIYSQLTEIAGWKKEELFLLLGTYNIVWGIFFGLFIHNLSQINKYINLGELDLFLAKPLNSQFYVSVRNNIDFGEASTLLLGIILVFYSLGKLGIGLSLGTLLFYMILVTNSVVLAYSLWFMSMTTSFWLGRIRELHETFLSFFSITKYPTEIFREFLRLIFVYFFPLAVLVVFPTKLLLGSLSLSFALWSFFISLFFLYLSHVFWNFGLRYYQSASS